MNAIDENAVKDLILAALAEDIGSGDITSQAIFGEGDVSRSEIVSKGTGVFCGGDMIRFVYGRIGQNITLKRIMPDGETIRTGDVVAELDGATAGLLAGERVTLNFLQRLCGIASKTRRFVTMVSGSGITILDTRKTLPGFRALDKYAVKCGSGTNHRMGLFDMVMIKDNHIKAAGGITEAVSRVRRMYGSRYRIEVESSNPFESKEAAECGVDIIMLDNMDYASIRESIAVIKRRAKIEVSGNIDETRITELLNLKIDYVSIGSLTHSVEAFDLSMKIR